MQFGLIPIAVAGTREQPIATASSYLRLVLSGAIVSLVVAGLATPSARALDPGTSPQGYKQQVWSTENGLPQNSVHAIVQTGDGYLWLGTEGGVARFDGYQFRSFDHDNIPKLPGDDVRCLLADRSGSLWIGTASGLMQMKDGDSITYTTADGLASDSVRAMLQTDDGTLWVLTAGGLSSATIGRGDSAKLRFRTFAVRDGMLSEQVNAIARAGDGGVWAGTPQGLNHIRGTGVERGPPGTFGRSIDAMSEDDSGTLLFATSEGVMQLRDGAVRVLANREALPVGGVRTLLATPNGLWAAGRSSVILIQPHAIVTFATGRALPGTQIEAMLADRKGAVWIGTNNGLARWWSGQMQRVTSGGDKAAAVLSMYEDREGDLWLGTETSGVIELRDPLFETISQSQGLPEQPATSVLESGDGSLWVGTDGGGITHISGGHAHTYTAKDGLASDTVLALANDLAHPADLWVGTPDGLTHIQGNRMRTYGTADGLADEFVRSLFVARDGAVWVGTRHGVTRWKDGHGATLTTADGLGSDLVGTMLEDAAGDQWIGTRGGLARIHAGGLTNFTIRDGLPGNVITALAAGADGSLWVGTNGQGLAVRNGQRFFSFSTAAVLPRTIYAVLEDGLGSLWLSSDHGLDRVTLAELSAFRSNPGHAIAVEHYGTADGLASLEGAGAGHPSAWRMADGRLCFATRRGIVLVNPARLPAIDPAPSPVIEQMTVDDREVTRAELASLAPGPSHFSFSFAGINLASPQRVQYRYRLEGFDRDWIDAGQRRTAFYTNLPHGRYRFRFSVRNAGGAWSESVSPVDLELRARFYQKLWFALLLAFLLAAFLFGLYRLRVQTLKSKFAAVSAERNRMAREIHDTLAQGFVAVSVRLEIMAQKLRGNRIEECREQLDDTRTLVQQSLAEARRSIWNLRAEGTDSQTLPARLARSVREASARGIDAQLETAGTYRPLDVAVEDELYRIAQEAIANALRHAEPTILRARLEYTEELVQLEITDDGCGFDLASAPSQDRGHFGLTGMRERAREIGASLMLESSPGEGATVRVEVPLHRAGKQLRKRA